MYGRPIPLGDVIIWELPITPEMIKRGTERRKLLPLCPKNSITNGTRTLHGLVGEEMVAPWFRHRFETNVIISDNYHHDLIVHHNILIDLKAKVMEDRGIPHHDYDVSVADANTNQQCDFYAFARIYENFKRGFFLGLQRKEEYLGAATFRAKAEMDDANKYSVQDDCWNRQICELG